MKKTTGNRVEMEVRRIPIPEIRVPDYYPGRNRIADPVLQEIITRHGGLLHPILVREEKGYVLLRGLEEYKAAGGLRWETVLACVYPAADGMGPFEEFMIYLDERWRPPENQLDLAEWLCHGKKLYEEVYPEAQRRANAGRPRKQKEARAESNTDKDKADTMPRFTKYAADRLSISETTVKNLLRLPEELTEEQQKELRRGDLKYSKALKLLPAKRNHARLQGESEEVAPVCTENGAVILVSRGHERGSE